VTERTDLTSSENVTPTTRLPPPALWRLVVRNLNEIVAFNTAGKGPPFYCVHSVTGDATSYHNLAKLLGPEQRFYGIQVPRERMNPAFAKTIDAVARHHIKVLIDFQPDGPLVLGGWSSGAIIALEMAQQLRAIGRDVPLLIAFDGAPCNTGAGMSRWNPLYSWKLACNLPRWIRGKGEVSQGWSWGVFVRRLAGTLIFQMRVTSPRLRNEQTLEGDVAQALLDSVGWSNNQRSFIRALYDASRAYVPQAYAGRVVVYEAKTQPLNHLRQVGPAWSKIAPSANIVQIQTNHLGMFEEPCLHMVAEHLHAILDGVRRG
jgi:thioesterase domain-containing protein